MLPTIYGLTVDPCERCMAGDHNWCRQFRLPGAADGPFSICVCPCKYSPDAPRPLDR